MRRAIIQMFAAIVAGMIYLTSPICALATPIHYVYDQTSASVPYFQVTASLVVDGGLGAIPNLDNFQNPGPFDFGPLLDFNFAYARSASLSDFTTRNNTGFPLWSIGSGGEFFFIDKNDEFDFRIGDGFVSFNSDDLSTGCGETGLCTGEGHWVAVPEPTTVAVFGSTLLALTGRRRKKSQ